jgi:hypothetical protein
MFFFTGTDTKNQWMPKVEPTDPSSDPRRSFDEHDHHVIATGR